MTNIKTKQADKKGTQETQVQQTQYRVAQDILDGHQTTDLEQMRLEKSDVEVKGILFEQAHEGVLISVRTQLRYSKNLGRYDHVEIESYAVSKVWEYLQKKCLDEYRDVNHATHSLRARGKGAVKDEIRARFRKSKVITYVNWQEAEGVNPVTPEAELVAKQLLEIVQGLDLSDNESFVLNNVLLGDMTPKEASKVLGVHKASISKMIKRVRVKAAKALLDSGWNLSAEVRQLLL